MAADLKHLNADAMKSAIDEQVAIGKGMLDDMAKRLKDGVDQADRLRADFASSSLLDLLAKAADARVTEFTLDRDGGELQVGNVHVGGGFNGYVDLGRSSSRIFGPPLKAGTYRVLLLVLPVDGGKVKA